MMRLVCNGVALDLMSGATLAFKKVNPLFAFDNLTCERTQTFSIPSTTTNERVLQLSKIPAYNGQGMRRRFECEMQDGIVVKKGYLYVDSFDGKTYQAIFVTGDLLGLLKLKQAGRIIDYVETDAQATWGNPQTAGYAHTHKPLWMSVNYLHQFAGGTPYPSYSVWRLLSAACSSLGITTPTIPTAAGDLRVIPGKLNRIDARTVIRSVPVANSKAYDPMNAVTFDKRYFEEADIYYQNGIQGVCSSFVGYDQYDVQKTVHYLDVPRDVQPDVQRTIKAVKSKFDISVTFPDDEALDGLVMFSREISADAFDLGGLYQQPNPVYGWGLTRDRTKPESDYAIISVPDQVANVDTWNIARPRGQAVRGRTLQMKRGEVYSFIYINDFSTAPTYAWTEGAIKTARFTFAYDWEHAQPDQDYEHVGIRAYELNIAITSEEPTVGNQVYLQPNLPDITLIDLMKTIAYMYGRVLNYTDGGGITFETLSDMSGWPRIDVTSKLMEASGIQRRFADYAQANIVRFDSYQNATAADRLAGAYRIDNDNIAEKKDLYVVPFSEGSISETWGHTNMAVLIRNKESQETDKSTIVLSGNQDTYLGRVSLYKNAGIDALCVASTCMTARVRMSVYEYDRMTAKTLILLNGTLYVWTEATLQGEVATLKLSKI